MNVDRDVAARRAAEDLGRSRKAALNFVTGMCAVLITMCIGLFTTPLMLRWLGQDAFGGTRATTELNGYLGLLELGLGTALASLLSRSLSVGDERGLRQGLAAGVRTYARVALSILAIGAVLTPIIPRLIKVAPGHVFDLRMAWMIGLLGWAMLPLSPFRSLTEAEQRGYRVNLVIIVQSLLTTGLMLLFARRGWGMTGYAAGQAIGTTFGLATMCLLALRRHPELASAIWAERPAPETRRSLRRLSGPTLVVSLCGRLSLVSDYIIVTSILRAEAAGVLFTTQRLAVLAQGQLQAIGVATWAGLIELFNRGELATFRRRLLELTELTAVLGCATLGPIFAFNHYFVRLWVGRTSDAGEAVILAAVVNAFLMGLFSLWTYCFTGTGRIAQIVPGAVISAVVNVSASIALTYRFGVVGPLFGTTAAFLTVNAWYLPMLMRRNFDLQRRDLLGTAVGRVLLLGIPYVVLLRKAAWAADPWGWSLPKPWPWFGLAAEMAAACVGFVILYALILLTPRRRAEWVRRIVDIVWIRPGPAKPRKPADRDTDAADIIAPQAARRP